MGKLHVGVWAWSASAWNARAPEASVWGASSRHTRHRVANEFICTAPATQVAAPSMREPPPLDVELTSYEARGLAVGSLGAGIADV